jgi:hypothetical protein
MGRTWTREGGKGAETGLGRLKETTVGPNLVFLGLLQIISVNS